MSPIAYNCATMKWSINKTSNINETKRNETKSEPKPKPKPKPKTTQSTLIIQIRTPNIQNTKRKKISEKTNENGFD